MKAKIYNLIILDESGSMDCVENQTISGCNETINTIRAAHQQFADTQEHFLSIFAFQGGGPVPSRYICKNVPVAEVKHISNKDYSPFGMTPLYDAVGSTLADLKAVTNGEPTSIGSVTIITDGEENDSKHYTLEKVAKMISALKEIGWNFNFIGANIDVTATAKSLNIDNALEFKQDEEGTRKMFERQRSSHRGWMSRTSEVMADYDAAPQCAADQEALYDRMRSASDRYFDDDRGIDDDKA